MPSTKMAHRKQAECLATLGLGDRLCEYDADDIRKAWKAAFFKAHPDKGGSAEACVKITNARDYLLEALVGRYDIPPDSFFTCEECLHKRSFFVRVHVQLAARMPLSRGFGIT